MDKVLFSEINNHHTFCLLKEQVYALCKPLLTNLPVDFYTYERYYHDGSYLTLSAESEALTEYAKYENIMPDIDLISLSTSRYVFLSEDIPLPSIPDVDLGFFSGNIKLTKDLLGITHRFSLIFNASRYIEIHTYGIKGEVENIVYFFMNHLKILEFFCKYFCSAAQHLIAEAEKNKLYIPPHNAIKQNKEIFNLDRGYKQFFKEIRSRKHELIGKSGTCSLSPRELECLVLTTGNKTAKEIGKVLCLSPRTVEEYLVSIRNKLGCESKPELIQVAHENPIIETFAELFSDFS